MQTFLTSLITNEKLKGTIAIVMYLTPDYVDAVVEALLTAFGITKLAIREK